MPRVPFIGRLFLQEYFALVASFLLIGLEIFVRGITLALPRPIIRILYGASRRAFNLFSSPQGRKSRNKKRSVTSPIARANDFVELCNLYGYYAEEHVVQTGDGYLLGLHRLGWRKGEEDQRVNSGKGSIQKKVVYMHHGLMMNSEVWVCLTEQERCLPFKLVEQGYDVWLGNNRGNKYSKKSIHHSPTSTAFWNFSMDQFAFHDIPDSIEYVLSTTRQASLSYIGFSQGTAQAFATLSIHPNLNEKVDVFIALAPAMAPPGLASGIVSSFVKASPEVLFLAFGRKAILSNTTMWQALLYPALFCWFIDKSLSFLFGWHSKNISPHQKLAAYPHLYSFSSTKCVVHWFQIIRNGTFQMFDDEVQAPLSLTQPASYYKVAKFPTRNIKTPIVLVYGGSDSLVDIRVMLKELPKHTVAKEIPHYEHLDFLWASDVDRFVFPHVLEALEFHGSGDKVRESGYFRSPSSQLPSTMHPPSYSDDETQQLDRTPFDDPVTPGDLETPGIHPSALFPSALYSQRLPRPGLRPGPRSGRVVAVVSPPRHPAEQHKRQPGSPVTSQLTDRSSASRPEGWWSSDEAAGNSEPPSPISGASTKQVTEPHRPGTPGGSSNHHKAQPSFDSVRSSETKINDRGISFGLAKSALVEGVVNRDNAGQAPWTTDRSIHPDGNTKKRGWKDL